MSGAPLGHSDLDLGYTELPGTLDTRKPPRLPELSGRKYPPAGASLLQGGVALAERFLWGCAAPPITFHRFSMPPVKRQGSGLSPLGQPLSVKQANPGFAAPPPPPGGPGSLSASQLPSQRGLPGSPAVSLLFPCRAPFLPAGADTGLCRAMLVRPGVLAPAPVTLVVRMLLIGVSWNRGLDPVVVVVWKHQ